MAAAGHVQRGLPVWRGRLAQASCSHSAGFRPEQPTPVAAGAGNLCSRPGTRVPHTLTRAFILLRSKRAAVVAAARHAWRGYEAYAMGSDELQPLSRQGKNSFGGLGATIVDSLDTLWMLGLREEFGRARDWVARELTFDKCGSKSTSASTKWAYI